MSFLKRYFRERSYVIGFIEKDPFESNFDFKQVKWLDTGDYRNGWFADPFIHRSTDTEIYVFAEEYEYSTQKGRLVYLTILRDGYKLKQVDVILDLDTHLSFPIYIEENGKTYVYPENYQGGAVNLYEFDEVHRKLINPRKIINRKLLDTQIVKLGEKYYAMGVLFSEDGQNSTRTLKIFSAASLFGEYVERQCIENYLCEERGAGQFIYRNGSLIRPAQCCEGDYGRNVIFYEMSLTNDIFYEKELFRLIPVSSMRNGLGLHTYNSNNNLAIIDGLEFRHRILGRVLDSVYKKWGSYRHRN